MKKITMKQVSELTKILKKNYSRGSRVRLIAMKDLYTKIPEGALGTVTHVDDMATVHVKWDTGHVLGVVIGEDIIEKVLEEKIPFTNCDYCKTVMISGDTVWSKKSSDFCSKRCALRYFDKIETLNIENLSSKKLKLSEQF